MRLRTVNHRTPGHPAWATFAERFLEVSYGQVSYVCVLLNLRHFALINASNPKPLASQIQMSLFQVMMFVTVISIFSVTFRSFKFTMEINRLWMIQTLTMVNSCIANCEIARGASSWCPCWLICTRITIRGPLQMDDSILKLTNCFVGLVVPPSWPIPSWAIEYAKWIWCRFCLRFSQRQVLKLRCAAIYGGAARSKLPQAVSKGCFLSHGSPVVTMVVSSH